MREKTKPCDRLIFYSFLFRPFLINFLNICLNKISCSKSTVKIL